MMQKRNANVQNNGIVDLNGQIGASANRENWEAFFDRNLKPSNVNDLNTEFDDNQRWIW